MVVSIQGRLIFEILNISNIQAKTTHYCLCSDYGWLQERLLFPITFPQVLAMEYNGGDKTKEV